jgi:hypothetical protein
MVRLADGSYLDVFSIRRVVVDTTFGGKNLICIDLHGRTGLKFEASTPDEARAEADRIIGEIESVGGPAAYLKASRPPVGWISPEQFAADANPFLSTLRAYQAAYRSAGEQRGDPITLWIAGRFGAMAAEVDLTGATTPEDHDDRIAAMRSEAEADARARLRLDQTGGGAGPC